MKCLIYTYRNIYNVKRYMSVLSYNHSIKDISNENFFKHKRLERIAHKFVKIPIHYQSPKELNATIVSGGNAFLKNVNFWRRCESATLRLLNCYSPSDLVHILNGFAKGSYFSYTLFNKIGHILANSIEEIKAEHFYAILMAYSTANIYIPNLIKAIERRISIEYSTITPSCLSLYLTTCDLFNYTLNKETLDMILPHLNTFSGSFSPEDYCRAFYGLIGYFKSHSRYLDIMQQNLISFIPRLPISLLIALSKKISKIPSEMISEALITKINEFAMEKTPLIPPSEIPSLLIALHSINSSKKTNSSILNSILNYFVREYKEIDCYGILTAHLIAKDFGIENQYLSQLVDSMKQEILNNKNKLIEYLKSLSDSGIFIYASMFISELIPCLGSDLSFMIELALIFKENNFIQGLEALEKFLITFDTSNLNQVKYLLLAEIVSNDLPANQFHPNVYAQALVLSTKFHDQWLKLALSQGLSAIDAEIIPAMLYSLVDKTGDLYSNEVHQLVDYVSKSEILSSLSLVAKGVLLKVIYKTRSHGSIVTSIFDLISTTPDIETYKVAILCLQTSIHLNIVKTPIIEWIINNSSLAKDNLSLVLMLLIQCNIRSSNYDLSSLSNAIDIALDLDNDVNRIYRLKQLARKLGIESTSIPETMD